MTVNSFSDFRKHVLTERFLSTDFFAETVTYTIPGQDPVTINVHFNQSDESEIDEANNEIIVHRGIVTIDRDDLPLAPDKHHKILRAGETRAYLFAHDGSHDPHVYRAVFERRQMRVEGM